MREILGRRRRLRYRRKKGPVQLEAALTFAVEWQWPVLPGAGLKSAGGDRSEGRGRSRGDRGCACPDPECVVPGAHPFDPGLLAATSDERMIRWWWTNRPTAPIMLATGGPSRATGSGEGRAPCAVSLPAVAASRALSVLDRMDMRLGPVVATPTRWSLLVAPYTLEQLGELLFVKDCVPSSLRFHGSGGYLVLPPSETGTGLVRWERAPLPGSAAPWLPDVEAVVDALVEASASDAGSGLYPPEAGEGSRLTY
ncbi:DNA primase [Streptomyces sp. Tu 2975]|uniref:bifunctional DNA primase/polymerase n=1 Tax=Streptomyces sp. Tu 2975 TaxID=2676871 RepID=UPI00135CE615|nr:bifunctional DNA primase/polymerase [Streptomyces sp. Tu 2975]QIP85679.1 DNA primase [Streptomyces sp. Tu 2975]